MVAFREWLFTEEKQAVDPEVLASYEQACQAELENLIRRTSNPALKKTLERMRTCPVRTRGGNCTGWTAYALGALLRHCPYKVDLEESLNYLMFRMLSRTGERGESRKCLFDMDTDREYDVDRGCPLEARYKTFLLNDIRSICGGKIRRLLKYPKRPPTVPITQTRRKADRERGTIGADEIPGHPTDQRERELYNDITGLLKRRSTADMPLVPLFRSILNGTGTREQRRRFGHTTADRGRKIIYDTLVQYASNSGNLQLQSLLAKFHDFDATKPAARRPQQQKPAKPKPILSQQERDFRSIVQVLERSGRRASMAIFGSQRSRWRERPSTDPAQKTKLHQVLDQMLKAGVLAKQGANFVPGPNYAKYLEPTPA
jgi:hypothetical protein